MPCPPSQRPSPTPGPDTPGGAVRAPFLARLAAFLYDTLVIIAIWLFTITLLVTVSGRAVVGAWLQTLLFLELYAFLAYFWIARGQTLGMLAWRLELRVDDGPVTLRHALLRFIGGLACIASAGIGFLWILIDRERRSWGDMLSRTYVVRLPKRVRSASSKRARG